MSILDHYHVEKKSLQGQQIPRLTLLRVGVFFLVLAAVILFAVSR